MQCTNSTHMEFLQFGNVRLRSIIKSLVFFLHVKPANAAKLLEYDLCTICVLYLCSVCVLYVYYMCTVCVLRVGRRLRVAALQGRSAETNGRATTVRIGDAPATYAPSGVQHLADEYVLNIGELHVLLRRTV